MFTAETELFDPLQKTGRGKLGIRTDACFFFLHNLEAFAKHNHLCKRVACAKPSSQTCCSRSGEHSSRSHASRKTTFHQFASVSIH